MKFTHIKENELEKINLMFNTMNEISDVSNDQYIESKMERYRFIAKIYDYSPETIRKIFRKTRTYKQKFKFELKNKYVFSICYYDPLIYLTRLNNERKKREKNKLDKNITKHYQVAKLIRNVAKATKNKTSGKTLSSIILEKLGKYYSPKHIYWLVRNGYIYGVTLRIFPMLKFGKYHKHKFKETKRFITTPISIRDRVINERARYGDVEIDTVEGSKLDNLYLSTMVDRKSRRLSITLYKSKSSESFKEAVKRNISLMLSDVLSITSDNGNENAKLNDLKIKWFATNAYSSWQKGTIEQKHKQIRKFIPKGRSFSKLTQEICDLIALIINVETYLQNPIKYQLGKIITKEELTKYFELISQKEPHPVFCLW